MLFKNGDAPLLIVMGQSNAHGHGTNLPAQMRITVPLQNVWGLSRSENQAYEPRDVTWSGFTSGGMNLGEIQDHTCCLAERFARKWQAEIDGGNLYGLPDLYVIQISIGAQGIHEIERDGLNMWYPDRPRVLLPGGLDQANISLYPLAARILALAVANLKRAGKRPRVVGLHWNQWETEVYTGGQALERAEENYRRLFMGFGEALGEEFPLYLYRPLSEVYDNPEGLLQMDELFQKFKRQSANVRLLDLKRSALWEGSRPDKGIFQPDRVHYSPAAHKWFADCQFHDLICRREGL